MGTLTAARVQHLFMYLPATGEFIRRVATGYRGCHRVGECAGSVTAYGYVSIRIDGRAYLAHRLAWLCMHGEWPEGEIDHLNGDRTDNRISNLRDVAGAVNRQNIRKAKRTSVSGALGVRKVGNRWKARVTAQGVEHYVGSFATKEEATTAYVLAKRVEHEGCTL